MLAIATAAAIGFGVSTGLTQAMVWWKRRKESQTRVNIR